ncbi:MAG: formyltetrahydrofolate deformylase, partial [Gammaproteobacteria bacterium]|nr:formyltetrahydrofolate deformylase [Gammaproteobacteria bacterium]
MQQTYILTVSCPDKTGITAATTGFIAEHGGWITEAAQHSDTNERPGEYTFFMRIEIKADSLPFSLDEFRQRFRSIADQFDMQWKISDSRIKPRIIIFVSKLDHCLTDLLYRWRNQEFSFDIPCVISNHENLKAYVEWHDIPFIHVPVTKENKQQAFKKMQGLINKYQGDAIVLARYMQILPADFCENDFGKI